VNFKLQMAIGMLAFVIPLNAGRIVINSDEWTLSNTGFASAGGSNAANFAINMATFLAGPGGRILIHSMNFGLTQSNLLSTLSGAGFLVTTATGPFMPTDYDAIFLANSLHSTTTSSLVNFVNAGGGVYIAAGTAFSEPARAASLFNPFLNTFGLTYASFHRDAFPFNDSSDGLGHPLFNGVTQLFYNGVNPVSTIGSSGFASVVELRNSANPYGLIAVFDNTTPIPEPSTFALLGAGLSTLVLARRRHRQNRKKSIG
jgi:hypothetical protein